MEDCLKTLDEINYEIKLRREHAYRVEVDIYGVRLQMGEVAQDFVQAIRDKIKADLPYMTEADYEAAQKRRQEIIDSLPYEVETPVEQEKDMT